MPRRRSVLEESFTLRNAQRSVLVIVLSTCLATVLAAAPPADLALELLTSGLTQPVAIRHAGDGTGRLFMVERAGHIRIYDQSIDTLLATDFLDISGLVDHFEDEQGLLGLAFHPDYPSNGYFYVNYTRDPAGPGLDRTVVARYTVSANPDIADDTSALVLLEIEQDDWNHNGGDLHFGPDGYLYISTGDGGGSNDPFNRAQNLGSLLGKMLRIDVDGTPPAAPNDLCGLVTHYGIPADNPFAGGSGNCDEIWAYGLRNPWRFSFDRLSGDILIGDVGQGSMEEIDFEPASSPGGVNYGWRCREGTLSNINNPPCVGPLTPPILTYTHSSGGCSVTGGYRYGGSRIGGLRGGYFYGDFCPPGPIWIAFQDSGGTWSSSLFTNANLFPSSFGEDEQGELYLVSLGGSIHRIVSPSSIFTDGFESGDTAPWTVSVP